MLMNSTAPRKLRVGILICPGQLFEDWEIAVFERIKQNSSLELATFVCAPQATDSAKPGKLRSALSRIEHRLFCRSGAERDLGLPEGLTGVPQIRVEDCKALDLNFDVLLSHIVGDLPPQALAIAKDVWEYHFNVAGPDAAASFGMREVLDASPVTHTALLRNTGAPGREPVGSFRTNTKLSGAFNAHYAKTMLPSLVERCMLQRLVIDANVKRVGGETPPPITSISGAEFTRYAAKVVRGTLRRLAQSVSARIGGLPEKWSLVLSQGDILSSRLDVLAEIPQPKGEYRADPFLFEMDGQKYVFFESWTARGGTGRIHAGILDGNDIRDIQPLDFGDIHLSYPYVFAHDGDIFMVPETHQRERVEVWRCTQFPVKWEIHATALEGQSPADTIILQHGDEWWLLTSLCTSKILDHCMELHAFRIDGPDLNTIEPHPMNPVVLDTTCGRNGGRPFLKNGRLIRPAQSSDHGLYGYGLRLMEITRLSINEYEEREVRRIEPVTGQSTTGCHHIDISGDVFILDARRSFGSRMFGARDIALRAV